MYQKLTTAEDETWLIRTCELTLPSLKAQLLKNEALRYVSARVEVSQLANTLNIARVQFGSVFIHLAVDSTSSSTRRDAIAALERLSSLLPEVVNRVIRDALIAVLSKDKPAPSKIVVTDDAEKPATNKQPRLASLLYTCASFKEDVDSATKQTLLADLLVLSHHPSICMNTPVCT